MWIKDKYGNLYIYENKYIKIEGCYRKDPISPNKLCQIDRNVLPEVKRSDEEPQELVLKPINEK
mgnify:CR=1 FL=1